MKRHCPAPPCCALPCGHVFHYFCLRKPLSQGAEAMDFKRINFGFANCPKCRTLLSHPALEDKLGPLRAIKAKVDNSICKSVDAVDPPVTPTALAKETLTSCTAKARCSVSSRFKKVVSSV